MTRLRLQAENPSSLGEDTFWTWMAREHPLATFEGPPEHGDTILRYSTLGRWDGPGRVVALCWELYPEMRRQLNSDEWDRIIATTEECASAATLIAVSTPFAEEFYGHLGVDTIVLPIGVDTDLFRPCESADEKRALRQKHGLPLDREIALWCGTTHPMKGCDRLQAYFTNHPDLHRVIVWKDHPIPQPQLAELMRCADSFLACGRLRPYFMVEWEAMASDLPLVFVGDTEREFIPGPHPRQDVFNLQWDRKTAMGLWRRVLGL